MSLVNQLITELVDSITNLDSNDELQINTVNTLMRKLNVNITSLTSLDESNNNIHLLLLQIKDLLTSDYDLNYEILFELLSNMVLICSDKLVAETYSEKDIQAAFDSKITQLVKISCKVLMKLKGKYLNESIIDSMVARFFDNDTDIAIISELENTFESLSNNLYTPMVDTILPNLKSQILSGNVDSILLARLLDILGIFVSASKDLKKGGRIHLFLEFDVLKLAKEDVLNLINLIKYTIKVIDLIKNSSPGREIPLPKVTPSLFAFASIYANIDDYNDAKYFAKSYLFQLFHKVSQLQGTEELYRDLDLKYLHINEANKDIVDFLSFTNPIYLLKYHKMVLDSIVELNMRCFCIIKNLSSSSVSFTYLKKFLSGKKILQMSYLEQILLIQILVKYDYSADYLLFSLPEVVSDSIISKNTVLRDPEILALKEQVLITLLGHSDTTLKMWKGPLEKELEVVKRGGS
ncbi:uncharacterized protein SCODWIG_00200 [Saccharomycodes ludwigii]|uniref:DNA mismatch repair protein HSM3 n=1 Tax=Saccharomycodes ludwigii TaxID=36035 RepID=A0A376B1E4_9ASCO|nr:hypothetical protein SCDLUD_003573 [Saccharomycodes ludwigii]KAH3900581.1 hypothetical protein SCDLUD_003573 [Saccharomycodes ludwigii]SSD58439.1 uncharacterized protein SCODWIG_00200 [Saccharomycodes ludwigii]